MDDIFRTLIEGFHLTYERLLAMEPVIELPLDMPKRGVYLFSEDGAYLYVGRSNAMRSRSELSPRELAVRFADIYERLCSEVMVPEEDRHLRKKHFISKD